MKTIKEWFESVENPILRKVLLMRYNERFVDTDIYAENLPNSIAKAFHWFISKEGSDFWESVNNELQTSNESPTFNAKYPVMQVEWLDENECIVISNVKQAKELDRQLGKDNFIKNRFYSVSNTLWYFPYNDKCASALSYVPVATRFYSAKLFIKDMKQDLLEEAKRRYPIGCKFKAPDSTKHATIKKSDYSYYGFYVSPFSTEHILGLCTSGSGATVYKNGNWASYVEVFGFKVGDIIEESILQKWTKKDENLYVHNRWQIDTGTWMFDRTIEEINFIDEKIAFRMSNVTNTWIKAEGLREFIEQQKQMKEEFLLPEKWCVKIENKDLVPEKYKSPHYESYYAYSNKINTSYHNYYTGFYKSENYTEITFEQFRQYVLRQDMKQYLTRKQLIELHKADDCKEWKSIIACYLDLLVLENDDYKVEIKQCDIDLADNKCSPKQLELLLDAGISFRKEIAVCESKDGDCIKCYTGAYFVNRNNIISVFQLNSHQEMQLRCSDNKHSFSPNIKGILIKEPLTIQIKIN